MDSFFLELLNAHIHIDKMLEVIAFLFFRRHLGLLDFLLFDNFFRLLSLYQATFELLSFIFNLSYSIDILIFFLTLLIFQIFV